MAGVGGGVAVGGGGVGGGGVGGGGIGSTSAPATFRGCAPGVAGVRWLGFGVRSSI